MQNSKFGKIICLFLSFLLVFEQSGFAQIAGQINISGYMAQLRDSLSQDKFRPLHLRYLSYDAPNNNFKILLDKGDLKNPTNAQTEETTQALLKYFLVGVSLPNDSFWVNLRPDSADNIIDPYLALTDVGKILLEADLQLKKDTAGFTSPQTPEGRAYWDKLYKRAGEIFGSDNITIPTVTRPWIVPDEIIVRESAQSAYIYKATLKVLLEQDYLKDSAVYDFKDDRLKELNEYSAQLVRELILPKIIKDVNTAKRYAPLRQVYYSLIMAQWFKLKFYGKGGLYSWLIDRRKLTGLISDEKWSKDTYFKAYEKSFRDGEYNIKEPIQGFAGQSIRSYFSGGADLAGISAGVSRNLIEGNSARPDVPTTPEGDIAMSWQGGNVADPGAVTNLTPQAVTEQPVAQSAEDVITSRYSDALPAHIKLAEERARERGVTDVNEILKIYQEIRRTGGFIGFGGNNRDDRAGRGKKDSISGKGISRRDVLLASILGGIGVLSGGLLFKRFKDLSAEKQASLSPESLPAAAQPKSPAAVSTLAVSDETVAINVVQELERLIELFDSKKIQGVVGLNSQAYWHNNSNLKRLPDAMRAAELFTRHYNQVVGNGERAVSKTLALTVESIKKEYQDQKDKMRQGAKIITVNDVEFVVLQEGQWQSRDGKKKVPLVYVEPKDALSRLTVSGFYSPKEGKIFVVRSEVEREIDEMMIPAISGVDEIAFWNDEWIGPAIKGLQKAAAGIIRQAFGSNKSREELVRILEAQIVRHEAEHRFSEGAQHQVDLLSQRIEAALRGLGAEEIDQKSLKRSAQSIAGELNSRLLDLAEDYPQIRLLLVLNTLQNPVVNSETFQTLAIILSEAAGIDISQGISRDHIRQLKDFLEQMSVKDPIQLKKELNDLSLRVRAKYSLPKAQARERELIQSAYRYSMSLAKADNVVAAGVKPLSFQATAALPLVFIYGLGALGGSDRNGRQPEKPSPASDIATERVDGRHLTHVQFRNNLFLVPTIIRTSLFMTGELLKSMKQDAQSQAPLDLNSVSDQDLLALSKRKSAYAYCVKWHGSFSARDEAAITTDIILRLIRIDPALAGNVDTVEIVNSINQDRDKFINDLAAMLQVTPRVVIQKVMTVNEEKQPLSNERVSKAIYEILRHERFHEQVIITPESVDEYWQAAEAVVREFENDPEFKLFYERFLRSYGDKQGQHGLLLISEEFWAQLYIPGAEIFVNQRTEALRQRIYDKLAGSNKIIKRVMDRLVDSRAAANARAKEDVDSLVASGVLGDGGISYPKSSPAPSATPEANKGDLTRRGFLGVAAAAAAKLFLGQGATKAQEVQNPSALFEQRMMGIMENLGIDLVGDKRDVDYWLSQHRAMMTPEFISFSEQAIDVLFKNQPELKNKSTYLKLDMIATLYQLYILLPDTEKQALQKMIASGQFKRVLTYFRANISGAFRENAVFSLIKIAQNFQQEKWDALFNRLSQNQVVVAQSDLVLLNALIQHPEIAGMLFSGDGKINRVKLAEEAKKIYARKAFPRKDVPLRSLGTLEIEKKNLRAELQRTKDSLEKRRIELDLKMLQIAIDKYPQELKFITDLYAGRAPIESIPTLELFKLILLDRSLHDPAAQQELGKIVSSGINEKIENGGVFAVQDGLLSPARKKSASERTTYYFFRDYYGAVTEGLFVFHTHTPYGINASDYTGPTGAPGDLMSDFYSHAFIGADGVVITPMGLDNKTGKMRVDIKAFWSTFDARDAAEGHVVDFGEFLLDYTPSGAQTRGAPVEEVSEGVALTMAPSIRQPQDDGISGALHSGRGLTHARLLFRLIRRGQTNVVSYMRDWARQLQTKQNELPQGGALSRRQQDEQLLRDKLQGMGFSADEINFLMTRVILCDLQEDIAGQDAAKAQRIRAIMDKEGDRVGGLIISTYEGNKILFLRERLSDQAFSSDLLHELAELQLMERGMEESVAHQQAVRIQQVLADAGPDAALRELRNLRTPHRQAKWELQFAEALNAVFFSRGIKDSDNLSRLSDQDLADIVQQFLLQMEARGWRGPPVFARLLHRLLTQEQASLYEKEFHHFDGRDILLILQRIHTCSGQLAQYGLREEILGTEIAPLPWLIEASKVSDALTYSILQKAGFAGEDWEKPADPQAREMLKQGKVKEVLAMMAGKPVKQVLPQLKAFAEHFGIDIATIERDVLLDLIKKDDLLERLQAQDQARAISPMATMLQRDLMNSLMMIMGAIQAVGKSYIIEKLLGRGKDGIVFLVRDQAGAKRIIKINIPLNGLTTEGFKYVLDGVIAKIKGNPAFVENFGTARFEVRTSSGRVEWIKEINEFVDGVSLRNAVSSGDLSLGQILDLARQFMRMHVFLADKGLINADARNLANVIVDSAGTAKLVDLGNVRPIEVQVLLRKNMDRRKASLSEQELRSEVLREDKQGFILALLRMLTGQQFTELGFDNDLALFNQLFVSRFGQENEELGGRLIQILYDAWSDNALDLSGLSQKLDREFFSQEAEILQSAGDVDGIVGAMHDDAKGKGTAVAKRKPKPSTVHMDDGGATKPLSAKGKAALAGGNPWINPATWENIKYVKIDDGGSTKAALEKINLSMAEIYKTKFINFTDILSKDIVGVDQDKLVNDLLNDFSRLLGVENPSDEFLREFKVVLQNDFLREVVNLQKFDPLLKKYNKRVVNLLKQHGYTSTKTSQIIPILVRMAAWGINLGLVEASDFTGAPARNQGCTIAIATRALAGLGDITKIDMTVRGLSKQLKAMGVHNVRFKVFVFGEDEGKMEILTRDLKTNFPQLEFVYMVGDRNKLKVGDPEIEDVDLLVTLVRPVEEVLTLEGEVPATARAPRICLTLGEYDSMVMPNRRMRSVALSEIKTGFADDSIGFFVNPFTEDLYRSTSSMSPQEFTEARSSLLTDSLLEIMLAGYKSKYIRDYQRGNNGNLPSEEELAREIERMSGAYRTQLVGSASTTTAVNRLASVPQWGVVYMHHDGIKYLMALDAYRKSKGVSEPTIIFTFFGEKNRESVSVDEFRQMQEQAEESGIDIEFYDLSANPLSLRSIKSQRPGITVVNLGMRSLEANIRCMALSNLPLGTTGDESLLTALTLRKPFLYELMSWKQRLFSGLRQKAQGIKNGDQIDAALGAFSEGENVEEAAQIFDPRAPVQQAYKELGDAVAAKGLYGGLVPLLLNHLALERFFAEKLQQYALEDEESMAGFVDTVYAYNDAPLLQQRVKFNFGIALQHLSQQEFKEFKAIDTSHIKAYDNGKNQPTEYHEKTIYLDKVFFTQSFLKIKFPWLSRILFKLADWVSKLGWGKVADFLSVKASSGLFLHVPKKEKGASKKSAGDVQVANVRRLDRLLRIINFIRQRSGLQGMSEFSSDREIIEACIQELDKRGLIETRPGTGGVTIISIKDPGLGFSDDVVNRFLNIIREYVIVRAQGVKAINFQNDKGQWIILGFANELADAKTLFHEQKEIEYRNLGAHWIDAHNKALDDAVKVKIISKKEASQQRINKDRAEKYRAGREDELGADVVATAPVEKVIDSRAPGLFFVMIRRKTTKFVGQELAYLSHLNSVLRDISNWNGTPEFIRNLAGVESERLRVLSRALSKLKSVEDAGYAYLLEELYLATERVSMFLHANSWLSPTYPFSTYTASGVLQNYHNARGSYEREKLVSNEAEKFFGEFFGTNNTLMFRNADFAFSTLFLSLVSNAVKGDIIVSEHFGEDKRELIEKLAARYSKRVHFVDFSAQQGAADTQQNLYIFTDSDMKAYGNIGRSANASQSLLLLYDSQGVNLSKLAHRDILYSIHDLKPLLSFLIADTVVPCIVGVANDRYVGALAHAREFGGNIDAYLLWELGFLLGFYPRKEKMSNEKENVFSQYTYGDVKSTINRLINKYEALLEGIQDLHSPEMTQGYDTECALSILDNISVLEQLRDSNPQPSESLSRKLYEIENTYRVILKMSAYLKYLSLTPGARIIEVERIQGDLERQLLMLQDPVIDRASRPRPMETILTQSGMASFKTILQGVLPNLGNRGVLIANSTYYELTGLIRGEVPLVDNIDEHDINGIKAAIASGKYGLIFIEAIANALKGPANTAVSADYPATDMRRLVTELCSLQYDSPFYCVIDVSVLGNEFNMAAFLNGQNMPANLHFVLVNSLQKFHEEGLELSTGGAITIISANAAEQNKTMAAFRQAQEQVGSSLGLKGLLLLDSLGFDRNTLKTRTRKINENARELADYLDKLFATALGADAHVIYPGLASHPDHAVAADSYEVFGPFLFLRLPNTTLFNELLNREMKKRGIMFFGRDSFGYDNISYVYYYGGAAIRISLGIEDAVQMAQIKEAFRQAWYWYSRPLGDVTVAEVDEPPTFNSLYAANQTLKYAVELFRTGYFEQAKSEFEQAISNYHVVIQRCIDNPQMENRDAVKAAAEANMALAMTFLDRVDAGDTSISIPLSAADILEILSKSQYRNHPVLAKRAELLAARGITDPSQVLSAYAKQFRYGGFLGPETGRDKKAQVNPAVQLEKFKIEYNSTINQSLKVPSWRVVTYDLGDDKTIVAIDSKYHQIVINTRAWGQVTPEQILYQVVKAAIDIDLLEGTEFYLKKRTGRFVALTNYLQARAIKQTTDKFLGKRFAKEFPKIDRNIEVPVLELAALSAPVVSDKDKFGVLSALYGSEGGSTGGYQTATLAMLNFRAEIENTLEQLKQRYFPDSLQSGWDLLFHCGREHTPFRMDYDKAVGNPYVQYPRSFFGRDDDVYRDITGSDWFTKNIDSKLAQYRVTKRQQVMHIGVVGLGYGQEPIRVATYFAKELKRALSERHAKPGAVVIKIHIIGYPDNLLAAFKENKIVYPEGQLHPAYDQAEVGEYFVPAASGLGYQRSAALNQMIASVDGVDLLAIAPGATPHLANTLDILMIHNVLQYLAQKRTQETAAFVAMIKQSFDYLDSLLTKGGILSAATDGSIDVEVEKQMQASYGDRYYNWRNPEYDVRSSMFPAITVKAGSALDRLVQQFFLAWEKEEASSVIENTTKAIDALLDVDVSKLDPQTKKELIDCLNVAKEKCFGYWSPYLAAIDELVLRLGSSVRKTSPDALREFVSRYDLRFSLDPRSRLSEAQITNGMLTHRYMELNKNGGYIIFGGSICPFDQVVSRGYYIITTGGIPANKDQDAAAPADQLGAEFDRIMSSEIQRQKNYNEDMPFNMVKVLQELQIKDASLIDDGPAGGQVYWVISKADDYYLVFTDKAGDVIGLAVNMSRDNSFGSVSLARAARGDHYGMLPKSSYSLFGNKIRPLLERARRGERAIVDKRLEFGSARYEDIHRGKIFLPLINLYFGFGELRNLYINNSIVRNHIRRLGVGLFEHFSGGINFIIDYKRLASAAAIAFNGNPMYDLHAYRTMDYNPMYYIELLAHEAAHERFRGLNNQQKAALRDYFLKQRQPLARIINNSPAYKNNTGDDLVTEMIAFIIGSLARGSIEVVIQDGQLRPQRDTIQMSDVDILMKEEYGFLPSEFGISPSEKGRMSHLAGKIDLEYLAGVYPPAVMALEAQKKIGITFENGVPVHKNQTQGQDATQPQRVPGATKINAATSPLSAADILEILSKSQRYSGHPALVKRAELLAAKGITDPNQVLRAYAKEFRLAGTVAWGWEKPQSASGAAGEQGIVISDLDGRRVVFGDEGFRVNDREADNAYQQKGGWKLHLIVKPANRRAVDEWLWNNHKGQYKCGEADQEGAKDFTIYVGSFASAQALAQKITNERGEFIENFNNSDEGQYEDFQFSPKVAGRFDIQKAKQVPVSCQPFRQYGYRGVPFDTKTRYRVFKLFLVSFDAGPVDKTQIFAEAEKETRRISEVLAMAYGEYFTGPSREFFVSARLSLPEATAGAPAKAEGQRRIIGSFKTKYGSTYEVDDTGCTRRDKTLHLGHLPSDVGLKEWSTRTIYVSPEDARRAGMHGQLSGRKRILERNGRLYLVSWNTQQNRWGISPSEKAGIAYTTHPEIGKAPVELRAIDNDEGWATWHAGNAIIEVSPVVRDVATTDEAKQKGIPAAVRSLLSGQKLNLFKLHGLLNEAAGQAKIPGGKKITEVFFSGSALFLQESGVVDISKVNDIDVVLISDARSGIVAADAMREALIDVLGQAELSVNGRKVEFSFETYPSRAAWQQSFLDSMEEVANTDDLLADNALIDSRIQKDALFIKRYLQLELLMGDRSLFEQHKAKFLSAKNQDYHSLRQNIEHSGRIGQIRARLDAVKIDEAEMVRGLSMVYAQAAVATGADSRRAVVPGAKGINAVGGIDFRGMQIGAQPLAVPGQPALFVPSVTMAPSLQPQANINLDQEWLEIEKMVQSGIVPSSERIKEYLLACCRRGDCSQRVNKVISCIAGIYRLEEERVSSSEPLLREFMVLLESGKPAHEMQLALSRIQVLPQDIETIGK